jgi:hypothetical protein
MTRRLAHLLVGLVLALFVTISWSTPGEAHAGHQRAATVEISAQPGHAEAQAPAERPANDEARLVKAEPDCGGRRDPGSSEAPCCSNACHAAMATELTILLSASLAEISRPIVQDPPALLGPAMHIKRPPRPSAASAG